MLSCSWCWPAGVCAGSWCGRLQGCGGPGAGAHPLVGEARFLGLCWLTGMSWGLWLQSHGGSGVGVLTLSWVGLGPGVT